MSLAYERLENLTGVRKGVPLNPSQNLRACYEIQDFYRKKGRLLCSVAPNPARAPIEMGADLTTGAGFQEWPRASQSLPTNSSEGNWKEPRSSHLDQFQ